MLPDGSQLPGFKRGQLSSGVAEPAEVEAIHRGTYKEINALQGWVLSRMPGGWGREGRGATLLQAGGTG